MPIRDYMDDCYSEDDDGDTIEVIRKSFPARTKRKRHITKEEYKAFVESHPYLKPIEIVEAKKSMTVKDGQHYEVKRLSGVITPDYQYGLYKVTAYFEVIREACFTFKWPCGETDCAHYGYCDECAENRKVGYFMGIKSNDKITVKDNMREKITWKKEVPK